MIRIEKLITLVLFMLYINIAPSQSTEIEADAIIGTWLMPEDEGIIEISKDGEFYSGKILWMKETEEDGSPLKDKNNPIDSLQNRELAGLKVMSNYKYDGENLWDNGTFYAAKKGIEVEPDFTLVDKNHLNIEISFFIFSITVELVRIDTAHFFKNRNKVIKISSD
ncbi:MAG: DUF2147 domain-containing protein [Melioribacteraceae bacterium]|nr:DUF2147 domain-containing protein [Melioribacteraceae bacterium]